EGAGKDASLLRALAGDLKLGGFDPLDGAFSNPWEGPRPDELEAVSADAWRTAGDTVERLELLAQELIDGAVAVAGEWTETEAVLAAIADDLAPRVDASGAAEIAGLMTALEGRFVVPGPSGAPTRGRIDVLPTGRNFYSLDSRTLPTRAAWELGQRAAEVLVERYTQDHGEWPSAIAMSAWGTANMRTGGDDIAQALALMGARPQWEPASGRVTGFEILPLARLGRPRVDVTFRISGFFRDAFPAQIDLIDSAVRAIAALDEPEDQNPLAARVRLERGELVARGFDDKDAQRLATARVFGSQPGAYGAGLQALMDEGVWEGRRDLADAYLTWGQYAYGAGLGGAAHREAFAQRLASVKAILHNQDNREHDILDSDDYYQFQGGLTVAASELQGRPVKVYHGDHSRPERPVVRALEAEIGRVVRGRAANPKWIAGVMRHGYKGAFEIAATVDYLFAFAATTDAVGDHHFDALYDAYLGNEEVRVFMEDNNPAALGEMADKFAEAIERELWSPRRNSVSGLLERLRAGHNDDAANQDK
ncbi:MAG TPA: cobaltochelatase subunit CobN, partial [Hyphomicrobiaceae bacterium]|nr:cobaltochelatase subunit CobN [Hyphomicrobiaceae bacterium]